MEGRKDGKCEQQSVDRGEVVYMRHCAVPARNRVVDHQIRVVDLEQG